MYKTKMLESAGKVEFPVALWSSAVNLLYGGTEGWWKAHHRKLLFPSPHAYLKFLMASAGSSGLMVLLFLLTWHHRSRNS